MLKNENSKEKSFSQNFYGLLFLKEIIDLVNLKVEK